MAIVLLALTINASLVQNQESATFTRMQAAQSLALKTESAVRMLDKGIAMKLYEKMGSLPPCIAANVAQNDIETAANATLNEFAKQDKGSVTCTFTNIVFVPNPAILEVRAKLTCTQAVGSTMITAQRAVWYKKNPQTDSGACLVMDFFSGCREYPGPTTCP